MYFFPTMYDLRIITIPTGHSSFAIMFVHIPNDLLTEVHFKLNPLFKSKGQFLYVNDA